MIFSQPHGGSLRLRLLPFVFQLGLVILNSSSAAGSVRAQSIDIELAQAPRPESQTAPVQPSDLIPLDSLPSSSPEINPLPPPPPEELLESPTPSVEELPETSGNIKVKCFRFKDNTVFSDQELAAQIRVLFPLCDHGDFSSISDRTFSFTKLLQIASKIAEFYYKQGYQTSGAIIELPENQEIGIVTIKVIEGKLEDIEVITLRLRQEDSESESNSSEQKVRGGEGEGSLVLKQPRQRLNPNYVRSRLGVDISEPLNVKNLLEALQLLQLDPLIKTIRARLSDGSSLGQSVLQVDVEENHSFNTVLSIDNSRSPSIGSFQRQVVFSEANLLGFGDSLRAGYANTEGSNSLDASYILPFNTNNGTISFSYSRVKNDLIESPFNRLDIESASRSYEIALRQPVIRNVKNQTFQELALGFTVSLRESETSLQNNPFPLLPGADEDGLTRILAVRFSQEWKQQDFRQVFAVRSQFNFGVDAFNSTTNEPIPVVNEVISIPDSSFFSWQGQAQWARRLDLDSLLLVRANAQLAAQALLSSEQFAIGGLGSVRGYRQDTLSTDNGVFASAEIRLPIVRVHQWQGVLQLIPFIEGGVGWNSFGQDAPNPNTLTSIGLGLRWQQGDNFTARLDWGIPLVSIDSTERTWQENGLYFSVQWNSF